MIKIDPMHYSSGYKHMLEKDMRIFLPWLIGYDIDTFHIRLTPDGWMTIKRGWGWDGCSGPTFDTKATRRGGCGHDAVSWLMRRKYIPGTYKHLNDCQAYDTWIQDGMWRWRADLWLYMLGKFGRPSILPINVRTIKVVP